MSARKSLLLINLGSPDAPNPRAVGRYLREFLCDPYVIDLPAYLRYPLVHAIIAPLRAPKSAEAYQKIWTEQGSPLVHYTRTFAEGVAQSLGPEWDVRWAMRYGSPSIASILKDWQPDELRVVPLYPQFAESSTRTALEQVFRFAQAKHIEVLEDFFDQAEFVEAQASQINKEIEIFRPDQVLLSYHGLPEHHLGKLHPQHCFQSTTCCEQMTPNNRYCYRAQAVATSKALRHRLKFSVENVHMSFQSRLGRRPWIKPYTDFVVTDLAKSGCRRLLVSCPSFVADCLETLEEIQMRLRDQFISEGGEDLKLVPALNAEPEWILNFSAMIRRNSLKWRAVPI